MISILILIGSSTSLYIYLVKKTRINKKYLFIDNVIVIIISSALLLMLNHYVTTHKVFSYVIIPLITTGIAFVLTMIRFWRTPKRNVIAGNNEIVSPADGNVIYVKKIPKGQVPVSIKKGLKANLTEITKNQLIKNESWIIGINMTLFDVHKNCSPVSGKIIYNQHFQGVFLSLKDPESLLKNERNTLVIETGEKELFCVIQTASKRVRRIDSYVEVGQAINKGDWIGMIRFGSQVDLIIPAHYEVIVSTGDQVYSKTSIIAKK